MAVRIAAWIDGRRLRAAVELAIIGNLRRFRAPVAESYEALRGEGVSW